MIEDFSGTYPKPEAYLHAQFKYFQWEGFAKMF